jgi:hypothetical protein
MPPDQHQLGIKRSWKSSLWGIDVLNTALRFLRAKNEGLTIILDHHFNSKIYTSGSRLAGEVVLNTAKAMKLEGLQILLVGRAETRQHYPDVVKIASHQFLRLQMPTSASTYPTDRVIQPSTAYNFPFCFTVPIQLAIGACSHRVETSNTQNHHLRLPPTLGSWERDDMGLELATITYSIEAWMSGKSLTDSATLRLEAYQAVNVIGATFEDPPLSLDHENRAYTLQQSCNVGTHLLSPSDGKIKATAAQPGAIRLTNDGYRAGRFTVPVGLTFEPSSVNIIPPQYCSISAKLEAQTLYSYEPMRHLPSMKEMEINCYPYRRKTVSLDPSTIQVQWSQHPRPDVVSKTIRHGHCVPPIFHTAAIEVPLQLPTHTKMFLPTFYSCLISRTYTTHLVLNIAGTRLRLSTPIQIILEPSQVSMDHTGLYESPQRPSGASTLYAGLESGGWPCVTEVLPGYSEV